MGPMGMGLNSWEWEREWWTENGREMVFREWFGREWDEVAEFKWE